MATTETLRVQQIDGEPWTEHRIKIWCSDCQRDTHPAVETMPEEPEEFRTPRCWLCGEEYRCDECGADLEVSGNGNRRPWTIQCTEDPTH